MSSFLEASSDTVVRKLLLKSLMMRTAAAGATLFVMRWFPNAANRLLQNAAFRPFYLYTRPQQLFLEVSRILLDLGLLAGLAKVCPVSPAVVSFSHLIVFNDCCGTSLLPQSWRKYISYVTFSDQVTTHFFTNINNSPQNASAIALFQSVRFTAQALLCTLVKKFDQATPYKWKTIALAVLVDAPSQWAAGYLTLRLMTKLPLAFTRTPARYCGSMYTIYCFTYLSQYLIIDIANRMTWQRGVARLQGATDIKEEFYPKSAYHEFDSIPGVGLVYLSGLHYFYATNDYFHNGIRFQFIKSYVKSAQYMSFVEKGELKRAKAEYPIAGKDDAIFAAELATPSGSCMHCKAEFHVGDLCKRLTCNHTVCRSCLETGLNYDWCSICRVCILDVPAPEQERMTKEADQYLNKLIGAWERQTPFPYHMCYTEWSEAGYWLWKRKLMTRWEANLIPSESTPVPMKPLDYFFWVFTLFFDLAPLTQEFQVRIYEI